MVQLRHRHSQSNAIYTARFVDNTIDYIVWGPLDKALLGSHNAGPVSVGVYAAFCWTAVGQQGPRVSG